MKSTVDREPITCIVLNWNGGQDTINCVKSLLASQNVAVEILVIDNGSSDGSETLLRKAFPEITLLKNSSNNGVAKAWNVGVRWAMERGSSSIFFLNNDAVVEQNCLVVLKKALSSNPRVGIVSPRILDGKNPGRFWFDGGFINRFGDTVHRNVSNPPQPEMEPFFEDFATGCAMLARAEVFRRVGVFDESYFAYSEDADLCLRSRGQELAIMHNPGALVTHYPSSATINNKGKWFRDYYVTRNKLLLVSKHLFRVRWFVFLLYFAFKHVAVPMAYFTATGQWRRVGALVRGVSDFFARRFGERYA